MCQTGLDPLKLVQFFILCLICSATMVTPVSSVQDGEAYAYLLKALAPEHSPETTLDTKDPDERAKLVLEQAEKLDCKRYLNPKDITEGSANLNLAFVAQIFQHR